VYCKKISELSWDQNAFIFESCVVHPFMSRDQKARRSHNIKIADSSYQRVEQFKYVGTTRTNQNSIQEEIKSELKSGNVCYQSVQNLMSSSLLSKNIKIRIYRTKILSVVLYRCETWSFTLKEERRLRVFENRVLRRMFRLCRDKVTGDWLTLHSEELYGFYSSSNTIRMINSRIMIGAGM